MPPASPESSVLIVGAGMAGLSLAAHLARAGYPRSVTLVEPRAAPDTARTFCGFGLSETLFGPAVAHRWDRWGVVGPNGARVSRGGVAYEHIPGAAFVARALSLVGDAASLRFGESVLGLEEDADGVTVRTSAGDLRAGLIFDSRPVASSGAVQSFVGRVVRGGFDPGEATLMDFRGPSVPGGVGFVYTLPFSRDCALVEATAFAPLGFDPSVLSTWLDAHLEGRETLAEERGAIPMDPSLSCRRSPRVFGIGLAGGFAKPSTGFAFGSVQRWSAGAARRLALGGPFAPPPVRPGWAAWMDGLFLRALARHPDRAPEWFVALVARTPPAALARFLGDRASPGDALRIAAALPKGTFVREALRR